MLGEPLTALDEPLPVASRSVAPAPRIVDTPTPSPFADPTRATREARRRAEAAAQGGDRAALARARTELGLLLELAQGDTTAALAEYRTAQAMAPSALAPIACARRLTPSRPLAPALALIDLDLRASQDDRTRVARLVELGRALSVAGLTPEKAVQCFRDALMVEPGHPGALRGLEALLRALAQRSERPEKERDREARDGREARDARTDPLDALARHLETMAAVFANDRKLAAWLHVERAGVLERMRKPEAARAALEAAVHMDPRNAAVREAYTRHLVAQRAIQPLVDALASEAAVESDAERAARLEYAAARLASERLDNRTLAIDLLSQASRRTPLDAPTERVILGELARHYETGDETRRWVEIRRRLLPLSDQPAQRAHGHRRLAKAHEDLEDFSAVVEHAQQALEAEPDDQATRERLDRALGKLGLHEQRISMWTAEASRLSVPSARAGVLLRAARIAETNLERPDLALAELRAAWAVDPSHFEVTEAIARLLTPETQPSTTDPQDPSRARARIDFFTEAAAAATDPARKIAYLERLALLWEDEVRAYDRALEVYREILSIEPKRRSAVLGLERNAARTGDARELYRALVLEADQADAPALERALLLEAASIASEKLNDADSALELVARVLARVPGDVSALRAAAKIHERVGRHDEHITQLRTILQHTRKPEAAFDLWIEIAVLLEERMRRPAEALAAYREAHRIDPAHPVPNGEIRRLLSTAGDHRALAEELVALAAQAAGDLRAELLYDAATIYDDRLDDAERTLALLAQVRTLIGDEPLVLMRIERALVRQGRAGDLAVLLDTELAKADGRRRLDLLFSLGSLLADDRDLVRGASLLEELSTADPLRIPALRVLEHVYRRTERWDDLARVLRKQAVAFETSEARVGALLELVSLEDLRGVVPPDGEAPAEQLLRHLLPDDLLLHEAAVRRAPLASLEAEGVLKVTGALTILAAVTPDENYAASLHLMGALLLERTAGDDANARREALRRYRQALLAWPDCLTAARGVHRLGEQLGDGAAFVEASEILGRLEPDAALRAERYCQAAEGSLTKPDGHARAAELFAKALGEEPNALRAIAGLIGVSAANAPPGEVVDAMRRALDRASQREAIVALGHAIADIAMRKLADPTVALEALRRVRKKVPGDVASLLALTHASVTLKLWADAAEAATSALGIAVSSLDQLAAHLWLAQIHGQSTTARAETARHVAEAERLLDTLSSSPADARALAELGDPSTMLVLLGALHQRLGDGNAAERALVKAILLGGPQPEALRRLAELYPPDSAEHAPSYAHALCEVIAQAEARRLPRQAIWLAALGKVEIGILGRPNEGLAKVKEAIDLDPGRMQTYETLADAYAALDAREDGVRELIGRLLALPPACRDAPHAAAIAALIGRHAAALRRPLQVETAEEFVAYLGQTIQSVAIGRTRRPAALRPAAGSLPRQTLVTELLPEPARGPLLALAAALGEIVPKITKLDPQLVTAAASRDRWASKPASGLRDLSERVAAAFGELTFDLQTDAAGIGVPRILPGDPAVLVLPRGYADLPEAEQAAGLSRLLSLVALEVAWIEEVSADELDGILLGGLRVGRESWAEGVLGAGRDANAELWRPRVAKAAGRKLRRVLEDFADRVSADLSTATWRQAVRIATWRAAYVLTGDLPATLDHALRTEPELRQTPRAAAAQKLLEHPIMRDLIGYALSHEPIPVRQRVGSG